MSEQCEKNDLPHFGEVVQCLQANDMSSTKSLSEKLSVKLFKADFVSPEDLCGSVVGGKLRKDFSAIGFLPQRAKNFPAIW